MAKPPHQDPNGGGSMDDVAYIPPDLLRQLAVELGIIKKDDQAGVDSLFNAKDPISHLGLENINKIASHVAGQQRDMARIIKELAGDKFASDEIKKQNNDIQKRLEALQKLIPAVEKMMQGASSNTLMAGLNFNRQIVGGLNGYAPSTGKPAEPTSVVNRFRGEITTMGYDYKQGTLGGATQADKDAYRVKLKELRERIEK
jgi:hypothetical protein